MNPLVLTCLLCFVVHGRGATQKPEGTFSALVGVTGGPASGEGLTSSSSEDDEVELNEELSGGNSQSVHEFHLISDEKKTRKGKGKRKNRRKAKSTTPLNPGHTNITTRHTSSTSSTSSTTQNPCLSTHVGYCIHGYCKHIEGLQEPVCICMPGYYGSRCWIQTLESVKNPSEPGSSTEVVQTVLVIIAVILSVISCIAILLMTCAHYRSHKNFLASYLGTGSEQEKLQKPAQDVVV